MKASELIKRLQQIIAKEGDLEVVVCDDFDEIADDSWELVTTVEVEELEPVFNSVARQFSVSSFNVKGALKRKSAHKRFAAKLEGVSIPEPTKKIVID